MILTALLLLLGANDQTYRLKITACPEAGLEETSLGRVLELELLPRRLTSSATVAATELGIEALPCRAYGAVFHLTYAAQSESLGDLDDLPPERRATALALLIPERLRARTRPLVRPSPIVADRDPPMERALRAAATLRASSTGTILFGAKIGGELRPLTSWLPLSFDLGASFGQSDDPLGSVTTNTYAAGFALHAERDGDYPIGVGPRLELGLVSLAGSANAGAAAGHGSALVFLAALEASARRQLDPDLAIELSLEAGYVISGLTATADDRELGGLEGFLAGASLGVSMR